MDQISLIKSRLAQINENNFEEIALEIFKLQSRENEIYARFLKLSGSDPDKVTGLTDIPFLPIRFFKTHEVKTGKWTAQKIFRSSGTTSANYSWHHIRDLDFYLQHSEQCYLDRFGELKNTHLLALLPSYIERDDSSLVAMVNHFIKRTGSSFSGFYLGDLNVLKSTLKKALDTGNSVTVIGVTFALLDLVDSGLELSGVRLMETGGMKGRRREMIREELHLHLKKLNPTEIVSEYGMTELLSQAYTVSDCVFSPSRLMKILIRDVSDPLQAVTFGSSGIINIIDLANIDTCSFIETQDLGRLSVNGFEILGRVDFSDVRGCSLLTI